MKALLEKTLLKLKYSRKCFSRIWNVPFLFELQTEAVQFYQRLSKIHRHICWSKLNYTLKAHPNWQLYFTGKTPVIHNFVSHKENTKLIVRLS